MLLHYFGEEYLQDNCHNCDNCLHPKEKIEASKLLVIVLKTVVALKENFRSDYVIDFIMGRETEEILAHKHHEHELFGAGEDEPEKHWNPVIRQALIGGYLAKEVENYGLLKITPAGKKFIKKPESFMIVEDHEFSEDYEGLGEHEGATSALDPISAKTVEDLFVSLKEQYSIIMVTHTLRQALRIADHVVFMYLGEIIEQGPADQVFHNPQHELTQKYLNGAFS